MKSLNKVYFIALIVFLMDFLSKNFVINNFESLKSIELIPNFFYITYLQNTGAAWSMFRNGSLFIAIISFIIFILISNYIKKLKLENIWSIISFGFLLGGILGNFIDRVVYGYVIDFLDFKIFGYDYPVFNFADIMIVVGTIMIAIKIIRGDKDANKC